MSNEELYRSLIIDKEKIDEKNLIWRGPLKTSKQFIICSLILIFLIYSFSFSNKINKHPSLNPFNTNKNNNKTTNETLNNNSNVSVNDTIKPNENLNNNSFTSEDDKPDIPPDNLNNNSNASVDDTIKSRENLNNNSFISEDDKPDIPPEIITINPPPRKTSYTIEDYQEYIKVAREGKFYYKDNLVHSEKPFISVVIALYNAEKYINATIRSVQNQRMKEIEIIIVDDFSKDKSLKYVEEAKKIDPRINILKNKKNMAILYTKSIGVLIARGDYVFPLDNDDMVIIDDLFEIIYQEATSKNYDLVEYKWIDSKTLDLTQNVNMDPFCVHSIGKEIFQPQLRRRFNRNEYGSRQLPDRYIWGRLIKKDIYVKAVEGIGLIDLQKRFTMHDDTVTTFMLFKYAYSFKKIDKIGLCHFLLPESSGSESKRYNPERIYDTCLTFLNYVDILYTQSEKDEKAREEAFWALDIWIIQTPCKTYEKTLDRVILLAKQFYSDPLISKSNKQKIKNAFINYIQ